MLIKDLDQRGLLASTVVMVSIAGSLVFLALSYGLFQRMQRYFADML